MADDEIVWEAPPSHGNTHHNYAAFFVALRERPGEWAVWPGKANNSLSTGVKQGRYKGTLPGEFEATVRGLNTDNPRAYVRYVGTNGQESESS